MNFNNNIYSLKGANSPNSSTHTLDPKRNTPEMLNSKDLDNSFTYKTSTPLFTNNHYRPPPLDTNKSYKRNFSKDSNPPVSAGSEFDSDDILNHYISSPDQETIKKVNSLDYKFKVTKIRDKSFNNNEKPIESKESIENDEFLFNKNESQSKIVEAGNDKKTFEADSNQSNGKNNTFDVINNNKNKEKVKLISPRMSDLNAFITSNKNTNQIVSSGSNVISEISEATATSEIPHLSSSELHLSESFKKEQDEWAEKGAAKIMKEIKNKETGELEKKIVSRGIKDFKFGHEIGDGSFSRVLLARSVHDNNEKYAIKILSKSYLVKQNKVKYVNVEKMALQRLSNLDTVVKMFFTFQDQNSLYFVLEYAPNGDFLSIMKEYGSLSEECTKYYSAQIIDAINDLHVSGIIHRDIKPENILLDQHKRIKLTDFGTANILEKNETKGNYDLLTRSKSFVGTAEYVSPELLNDSYTDYKCDIWAFGCILFQMIAGKPPFKAANEYLTFQKVQKIQYAFTAGFPAVIRDLVKRLLIKQPEQRLEIVDIKSHLFYKDISFSTIWKETPPPIKPYKMNAKSMAPIPELSSQPLPKSQIFLKRPAAPALSTNASIKSDSVGSSSAPSTPVGTVNPSQKLIDPRTQDILDQAKKNITLRKQQKTKSKKISSNKKGDESKNAAMAAMSHLETRGVIVAKKKQNEKKSLKAHKPLSSRTISAPNIPSKKSTTKVKTETLSVNIAKAIVPYMLPEESVKKTDILDVILVPTKVLNTLLIQKKKTLNDIPLFENITYYNLDNSQRAQKSINKPVLVFEIPENDELDPFFWTQDSNKPLTLIHNSDYQEKFYPLDVSHYEAKICCLTNLGRILIFVKGEDHGVYYLELILELNHKNTTIREITPSKHELTTNYQFVVSDKDNNSILFSVPQNDTIPWINCLKKVLFVGDTELESSKSTALTNSPIAKERMFDSFVSMRENQRSTRQRPNKPESLVNLINGLPSFSKNQSEGTNYDDINNIEKSSLQNTTKLGSVKKFLSRKQ
ncbi:hypothetical protein QEN19_000183 [Hanseniaspora menglaensis]